MKIYVVNGKFMQDQMVGIVRYSREILSALDPLLDSSIQVRLLVPPNAINLPKYKNIVIEQIGKISATRAGIKWEQVDLRKYLKQHRDAICINFGNVAPFFVQPGITVIHDIIYKVRPSYYLATLKSFLSRYWHILQYSYITTHEKKIITVSNFSKRDIEKYYPNAKGKVIVIPCAWQHVLQYEENKSWQEKYPFLMDKQFFFSLSTMSKVSQNKNSKWIIDAAKRNPNQIFAITGNKNECKYNDSLPPNLYILGHISDGDVCALIKHCRAFIFPSLYEGFGIPPLEALALGAEVISSNVTSLPEVLEDSVYYVDPNNANIDIENLLHGKVSPKDNVLKKYNWEKSAKMLYDLLKG